MGKATIFESPRLLVGLNAFEAGPGARAARACGSGQGLPGDRRRGTVPARWPRAGDAAPAICWSRLKACRTACATPAPDACSCWRSSRLRLTSDGARTSKTKRVLALTRWTRVALVLGLAIWTCSVRAHAAQRRRDAIVPAFAGSRLSRSRPHHLLAVRPIHDGARRHRCCSCSSRSSPRSRS